MVLVGGQYDKVGEDNERDARESSHQSGRRPRGGKLTGRRETGHKETGRRETGRKELGGKETIVKVMGVRETGGWVSGGKVTGAQVSQAMGGKGDMLMSERDPDNSLPSSDKAAGQNVMEGIHQKSYCEAVIEGVKKRAGICGGLNS